MKKVYIAKNPSETKKAGKVMAQKILKKKLFKKAFIIALKGALGSGKTTFLQGFAQALGVREKVLSPTFVILKRFNVNNPKLEIKNFYHIDCYRLQKPEDILILGFEKIISNPQNIVAIEWAEKIKKTLPKNVLWVRFNFVSEKQRKITYNF